MGRYSVPLAAEFTWFASVRSGRRALDVRCGPGALTGELIRQIGTENVSAVDPSQQFVDHVRQMFPGLDAQVAGAEQLPFQAETFDAVLAQLVVHFLPDPVKGLVEMRRTTKPGGVVAACVWDFTRDETPLTVFWNAARRLDPTVETEINMPGSNEGDLGELFTEAGLQNVEETALEVDVVHTDFEDWWDPFTLGVGPAGAYVASLRSKARAELLEQCRKELPDGGFVLKSTAWAARGTCTPIN